MTDNWIFLGSDRSMPPTRLDAVHNRAEILEAARRLFDVEGIANVTMSAIAKEANVGKGTLYRHFRDKADLCLALLDDEQRALQDQTLQHLRMSNDSAADKLIWFLRQVQDFTARNRALLCGTTSELIGEEVGGRNDTAHAWQRKTIFALLRQSGFSGDLDYTTDALFALLDIRFYQYQREVHSFSHQRIVAGLTDHVLRLLQE